MGVNDVKDVKELVSTYNNMCKRKNMYFPTRPLTCLTSLTPCNTNRYRGNKLKKSTLSKFEATK